MSTSCNLFNSLPIKHYLPPVRVTLPPYLPHRFPKKVRLQYILKYDIFLYMFKFCDVFFWGGMRFVTHCDRGEGGVYKPLKKCDVLNERPLI